MVKLISCVPNFSEGRNKAVIDAISASISKSEGCHLVDVDIGSSTNRTVYTFVGNPTAVVQGALNAAKTAYQNINMAVHKGEHPRFGAMDVCPFVPVSDVTMDDCVQCARELGELMSNELQVPVYLYGFAASSDARVSLPNIRSGEYENLPQKLQDTTWTPDFGPTSFVPSWGATAVGARNFLVAYNVNLISTKEQAHKIALNIREKGQPKQSRLPGVQAIGWYLDEHNIAQVSANLTDLSKTKLHQLFEGVCSFAKNLNLPVIGSEIVGLVPLQCFLDAAEFYIDKEKLFVLDETSKVQLVVSKLGLNQLVPFDIKKKIIEYVVADENRDFPLCSMSTRKYVESVAARTAAPGGGSVSALVASLGAALSTMGGQLSYGKKQWESIEETMRKSIPQVYHGMTQLLPLVDKDATAYNSFMAALKLPKTNPEEVAVRSSAMLDGILEAINVPVQVMKTCNNLWPAVRQIAQHGNPNCLSDVQVGARCLELGVWGAHQNVLINLSSIEDEALRQKIEMDAHKEGKQAEENCREVLELVGNRLKQQ